MSFFGWAGKVGWIDLDTGSVEIESTEKYQKWIGGRGLASHIVLENVPVTANPLSPENIVVISTGPMTGTLSPTSGRLNISSKNALTNGYGSANAGGYFAPKLKRAGFDALVIKGAAKTPVYLSIHNGKVEIHPAMGIWGLTTSQCYEDLKKDPRENGSSILCIGPAGEKRCKVANAMVDKGRSASYGGIGAVFGSKRLKAITVDGDLPIQLFKPEEFLAQARSAFHKVGHSKSGKSLKKYGTLLSKSAVGVVSWGQVVKNYLDGIWDGNKTLRVGPLVFLEGHAVKNLSCFNCPIPCSRLYRYSEEGRGKFFEVLEANHITNFGSMIDNDDPQVVLLASALCNDLGLDADSTACSIAWAFESFERGALSVSECDGLHLNWGNKDPIVPLIKRMAGREGIGDLLADGPLNAARRLGRGSEKWAMHIKGAPFREIDIQTNLSWALGVAVSTRGSGHLNGACRLENLSQFSLKDLELFGLDRAPDLSDADTIGRFVAWFEDFKSLVDSLGLCYFSTWWMGCDALGPLELTELFRTVTGEEGDAREHLKRGACIQNLEKAFNTLHAGFKREDDFPPERLFDASLAHGAKGGKALEKNRWNELLDGYYKNRKYDLKSGWQTRTCFKELALKEVERRLEEGEKLTE